MCQSNIIQLKNKFDQLVFYQKLFNQKNFDEKCVDQILFNQKINSTN